jgi:hypothetical protein
MFESVRERKPDASGGIDHRRACGFGRWQCHLLYRTSGLEVPDESGFVSFVFGAVEAVEPKSPARLEN